METPRLLSNSEPLPRILMTTRYLTKSRFKIALECPTKLYYTGKRKYVNARSGDEFLQALADGGFQVGELAKLMYPEGIEVTATSHDGALNETAALLAREEVTIFEAAIRFGSLFVRIDVLKKTGVHFELIEVKAKSYDPNSGLTGTKGNIKSDILPYLQDVAFQEFVLRSAFPQHGVSAYLMMANKLARCTVDQLNQRFKIIRNGSSHHVERLPGTDHVSIGAPLLALVPVSDLINQIIRSPIVFPGGEMAFADAVETFARHYTDDRQIKPTLGAHCGRCEFRTGASDSTSGFHTCWKQATGWSDADFAGGTVLDLWNFRGKDNLIRQGVYGLRNVTEADLKLKSNGASLSRSERQWMQVSGQWDGGGEYFLDCDGLKAATAGWRYPLHFIDFETSRNAIPFHIGRQPYEQVAFQFSHHVMQEDGSVAHAGQFLEATPGVFPNYAFVRELRRQLSADDGTILRWATHENSVLRDIHRQLDEDPAPPPDKDELQAFILEITSDRERVGRRSMVDLCKLAEHYYFHPSTKGSCSIKKVLPAVLSSCSVLRERYVRADYGSVGGTRSLNFKDWTWWQAEPGSTLPRDPYSLLPPVFDADGAYLTTDDDSNEELANGGAAMVAYSRLQFEKLSEHERHNLSAALLKYCELDTLAMVMIWQSWRARITALHACSRSPQVD